MSHLFARHGKHRQMGPGGGGGGGVGVGGHPWANRGAPAGAYSRGSHAEPPPPLPPVDLGLPRNLEERYDVNWDDVLGKGGFGIVVAGRDKATGVDVAVKAVSKLADGADGSGNVNAQLQAQRQERHVRALRNEAEALRRLRGAVNVATLFHVCEDETRVFFVLERCRGGELRERLSGPNRRPFTERTVASVMRAVLRTLAQCHAVGILHRDIKPGNFLFVDESDEARLKAVDFGLAVPFQPSDLPMDLGSFDGTPWYMAPEMLRSEVVPASDVFAAGVMAYQLLAGRFPFDDRDSPRSPSLSKVWKSILTDEPDFTSKRMPEGVTPEATDLIRRMLSKDPKDRPSASECLADVWLAKGDAKERHAGSGVALDGELVQRVQRFALEHPLRRSVLRHAAHELLTRKFPSGSKGAAIQAALAAPSVTTAQSLARSASRRSFAGMGGMSGASQAGGSLKAGNSVWMGGIASQRKILPDGGSVRVPRKNRRGSLGEVPDSNGSGSGRGAHATQVGGSMRGPARTGALAGANLGAQGSPAPAAPPPASSSVHGANRLAEYFERLRDHRHTAGDKSNGAPSTAGRESGNLSPSSHSGGAPLTALQQFFADRSAEIQTDAAPGSPQAARAPVAMPVPSSPGAKAEPSATAPKRPRVPSEIRSLIAPAARALNQVSIAGEGVCPANGPCDSHDLTLDPGHVADRLRELGYDVDRAEVGQMLGSPETGGVARSALLASLIDWDAFEQRCGDLYEELLLDAFTALDGDGDGVADARGLAASLGRQLRDGELTAAAQDLCLSGLAGVAEEGSEVDDGMSDEDDVPVVGRDEPAVFGLGGSTRGPAVIALGRTDGGIDFQGFLEALKLEHERLPSLEHFDRRLMRPAGHHPDFVGGDGPSVDLPEPRSPDGISLAQAAKLGVGQRPAVPRGMPLEGRNRGTGNGLAALVEASEGGSHRGGPQGLTRTSMGAPGGNA